MTRDTSEDLEKALTGSITLPYKVLGDIADGNDGIGVLGRNTATTGTTRGVEGRVDSGDGYGLYTPDDARVDGAAELTSLTGSLTGGKTVSDLLGSGLSVSDGSLTASGSKPSVSDDGSEVLPGPDDLNFASNLSVTDDSDGTVTVDASDTDTHTDVSAGGSLVVGDTGDIDFSTAFAVTDDNDGTVSVDVASGGIGTSNVATGAVRSQEIADGTIGTADLGQNGASDGQVLRWEGSASSWATGFPGTTTSTTFQLQADGTTGFRLEPTTGTVNVVGGENHSTSATGVAIGGGSDHSVAESGTHATISGGTSNTAKATRSTVGGGEDNTVAASGTHATVGGGYANEARGQFATIAGGGPKDEFSASSTNNVVYDDYGTIGGGGKNTAGASGSTDATYATVGGGEDNDATAEAATVGGGVFNDASERWATVGGGSTNAASGQYATIAGGRQNAASGNRSTIAGGNYNRAAAKNAAVGGGRYNEARAEKATIPGGSQNRALGIESFAAGAFAKAEDDNTFVWSDGSGANDSTGDANDRFSSSTTDGNSGVTGERTFQVKSIFGVRFVTSADNSQVAYISNTSAGWSNTSTRTAKTNIEPVEPETVLDGVESLEVSTWEYADADGEGQGERHIGPMAEEFHDAFDVGDNDAAINSINADGVALAAIQGLSAKLEAKAERIDDLEAENERLREAVDGRDERIADLAERLASLEARVGTDGPATPADD